MLSVVDLRSVTPSPSFSTSAGSRRNADAFVSTATAMRSAVMLAISEIA